MQIDLKDHAGISRGYTQSFTYHVEHNKEARGQNTNSIKHIVLLHAKHNVLYTTLDLFLDHGASAAACERGLGFFNK